MTGSLVCRSQMMFRVFLVFALAQAIPGLATPMGPNSDYVGNRDIASVLARAANDPAINDSWLPEAASALSKEVAGGISGKDKSVEDAWNAVQDIIGKSANVFDVAANLAISGVIPSDILRLLNGYANQRLNALDNENPSVTGNTIYPRKMAIDAPYSIDEVKLRAVIYIPESFKHGKDGKKPVILVPGTGVPAGTSYYFNFGKLADAVPEADVVWVNIPGASLADVQISSEYIAYAINYISAVTESNVSVISWSQGGLNTQWSLKYWPSTRHVVDDFIAISPDFRGTLVADAVCPLLSGVFCTPSLFQQRWGTEFINTLREDGGSSAYVPTTTVYSSFDEIVQPMSGANASALLDDAQVVGVSNNHLQTICALQPAGGVYLHEGMLYNPLTWALAADALRHEGPGDTRRIDTEKVCEALIAPQLGADDLLGSEGLLLIAVAEILAYSPKAFKEPVIARYAL